MTFQRLRAQIYASSADAAFADRLAVALDVAGFEVVTGDFEHARSDAVVVVWSGASKSSRGLLAAAKAPFEAGVLVPVSIGAVELPAGFATLPPADLAGWTGGADDPRWRFVINEISRAVGRRAVASQVALFPSEDLPSQELTSARPEPALEIGGLHARTGAAPILAARGDVGRAPRSRAPLLPAVIAFAALALAGGFSVISGYVEMPRVLRRLEGQPAPEAAQNPPAKTSRIDPLAAAVIARTLPPAAPVDVGDEISLRNADLRVENRANDEAATVALESPPPPSLSEASAAEKIGAAKAPPPTTGRKIESGDAIAALIQQTAPPARQRVETREVEGEGEIADEKDVSAPQGHFFKDCELCPEMATLASGRFTMGSPQSERARRVAEGPQTELTVGRFAIGTHEVTFEEWDACIAAGACAKYEPDAAGWGRGRQPVVNVSWADAQKYVSWLSETTGRRYRLPSEAEWEYAARAGTATPFASGSSISSAQANYDGTLRYSAGRGRRRGRAIAVGSFAPNAFGLFDMHGNVWEWTQDCWRASLAGRPADASAVGGQCATRVLKGGAWNNGGWRLRSAHRIGKNASAREYDNGFRVARDL